MKKYIINLSLCLLLFSCDLFSKDSRSHQKYNFKVPAKSVSNPTNKEDIDTEKGTNTTLCIKEADSRIIIKDCINNQELFKVKSKRRYDFKKAMLLGVKTALKVINIGNNNKKLNSIKKHKDHILLEFKDNKIYIIRLSELKRHLLKSNKKPLLGSPVPGGGDAEFVDDPDGRIEAELEAEKEQEMLDREDFGDEEDEELEEEIFGKEKPNN
ncbi:hypothetical protein [Borreliella bissettiae]|uniref:Lipoprotein n=1 Tax=Borrelia bissettiae (strain DSM 17990 / CIP 109136 / DN127) TaxID=521010 RepID=G0APA8_BORBD|nr:hypothetical protein [Borreliella bissettiae]AEL19534.1 conserved hypothetical protein [Borreliella bissettiae DN127]